jgi:hypothetical protein
MMNYDSGAVLVDRLADSEATIPDDLRERALDPSTPWGELVELWLDFPEAILSNPILSLQALSEGRPLYDILPEFCRVSFYTYLAQHEDGSLLERYISGIHRKRLLDLLHAWLPANGLTFLQELAVSQDRLLWDYARCLAKDPSLEIRITAAERLPADLLESFLNDDERSVRMAVVANLANHYLKLGRSWTHPREVNPYGRDPFTKSTPEVIRDVVRIAEKLMEDPDETVRAENLAGVYSDQEMFERALEKEGERFFLHFARRRNWSKRWDSPHGISEEAFVSMFARYPSVAEVALKKGGLSSPLLWRLTQHENLAVSNRAWERFRLTRWSLFRQEVMDDYQRLFKQGFRVSWFENLARKQGLSDDLARALWDQGGSVRRALYENPIPTREVVCDLLENGTVEDLIPQVAKQKNVTLTRAALQHPDFRLRALVARFPGYPVSAHRPRLAKDPCVTVRKAVVDYYLSTTVCYHGGDYNQTLSDLTRDPNRRIRKRICRDQRLGQRDIVQLLKDPDPKVALETFRHHSWRGFRHALPLFAFEDPAIRRKATALVLEERTDQFGDFSDRFVHQLEATLIQDPDPEVRRLLARDPWTSPQACWKLMGDSSEEVRRALLEGYEGAEREKVREAFLKSSGKERKDLSRSRNPWCRACLLRWYQKDPCQHGYLARDPHWFVRAVAASSRRLHRTLHQELLNDPDPIVRSVAEARVVKP